MTGKHAQVVLMNLNAKEDIGKEIHKDTDQIIEVAEGKEEAVVNEKKEIISEGSLIFVPAGKNHNFTNTENKPLKLISIYAPPEHKDGTIHKIKTEAQSADY